MPVVVVACVVALFAPLVGWWVARADDADALGGLAVFVAGLAVGVAAWRGPPGAPRAAWGSLVAGCAACVFGVVVDVRTAQMAGALCLAHVAVSLLAPTRATALLPALWLTLLGLPLAGDLDVVGFGARVFAADVARLCLSLFGAAVGSAETVLVVEGNVADVEAPCAGLSTLRMLSAVVLVLGALRRTGHLQLLCAFVVAGAVAVVCNAARVTALAALVLVAHRADLAALVHVPLGVLAFAAAVFVADVLLRGAWRPLLRRAPPSPSPAWTRAAVVGLVVVTGATSLLRLETAPRPPLPTTLASSPSSVALTPAEEALFGRHALWAEKRLLRDGHGSALVVVATSLRAHHAPERCLAGSGLRVDASTQTTIAGVPVKKLVLDGGAHTGISFYVRNDDEGAGDSSRAVVFGSLFDRAADQLTHRGPWAFVSAVVDADADLDALVPELLEDAHARLGSPPQPTERP